MFQSNYQVTRKAVSFEWAKRKTPCSRCRLKCKDTAYWSVLDGRLCCNAVCVWQNELWQKTIGGSLWRSLVSWNKAMWSVPLKYMSFVKQKKETLGNFVSEKKKKLKGNRFILPFDKTTTIKNKKKWFLRSNRQKWRQKFPWEKESKQGWSYNCLSLLPWEIWYMYPYGHFYMDSWSSFTCNQQDRETIQMLINRRADKLCNIHTMESL